MMIRIVIIPVCSVSNLWLVTISGIFSAFLLIWQVGISPMNLMSQT